MEYPGISPYGITLYASGSGFGRLKVYCLSWVYICIMIGYFRESGLVRRSWFRESRLLRRSP